MRTLDAFQLEMIERSLSDVVILMFNLFISMNSGQERFGNMTRVYYKEAVGAFIVFDVTRVSTFEAVQKWKNDLDSKVHLPDGSPIPCVLLANKVSLTQTTNKLCTKNGRLLAIARDHQN